MNLEIVIIPPEAHLTVVHLNPKMSSSAGGGLSIFIKINQEHLERFPAIGHHVAWKLQFRKKNVIKLLSVSDMGICGRVFKAVDRPQHTLRESCVLPEERQ